MAHAEMNSRKLDRAVFYIFNSSNGYVIVSGDDRAEEILGYGDGQLDINTIPCNMKAWLATYKEQIEYLQDHEGLQVETPSMMAPSLRIPSVAPLLTAEWDQEAPYWNMCKINNYQCLTGCPATSAAMVFHYWKYPDYMTPEVPGYKCTLSTGYYSTQSVNVPALPPVVFDWEHMRDKYTSNYTSEEANAVATLMRYVGQAERMEYGTSAAGGSGVAADSVILIVNAFKLFGYDEETVHVPSCSVPSQVASSAAAMPSMLTVMMPIPTSTTSTSVGVVHPTTIMPSTPSMVMARHSTSTSRW